MDLQKTDLSQLNLNDLVKLSNAIKLTAKDEEKEPRYNTCCCCAFDQWWANTAYAFTLTTTCYYYTFWMDWWWYIYLFCATPQLVYSLCCQHMFQETRKKWIEGAAEFMYIYTIVLVCFVPCLYCAVVVYYMFMDL